MKKVESKNMWYNQKVMGPCSGVKACCKTKTVGDVEYILVGENKYTTVDFECKDACIYRRWATINFLE